MKHNCRHLLLPLCAALLFRTALGGQDWPQLWGPNHDAVAGDAKLATEFPGGKPRLAWQANVGFGLGPVVVRDNRVYAFGLFKPGLPPADIGSPQSMPLLEEMGSGTFSGSDLPGTPESAKKFQFPPSFRGDLYAQCFDAATGKNIWKSKVTDFGIAYTTRSHGGTAWEMASPLILDDKLYFHSHTGQLYCLSLADGKVLWKVNLFEHRMSNWCGGQQGNSCSPLAANGHIVVSYEGDFGKKGNCLMVGAFDAATGAEKWVAQAPMASFNAKTARINLATLGTQLTVLCSCGGGTIGIDPATGKVLWSFDLFEANSETMKQVPARYATPEKTASDYRKDAMRAPFPGYAPVVWNNYVIDAACVGHNSCTSATWCLKADAGTVTRTWQTSAVVPLSASKKSHMIARDGKLYLFDSYFPGFAHEYSVSRPYRGAAVGQFQCWDITAGKMLWSSDAFHPEPPGIKRVDTTECLFVLSGAHVILCDSIGLSIGLLQDNGVKVLSCVLFAQPRGRNLAEPVLAGTQLFVRQLDSKPETGLLSAYGKDGNLFCFDLGGGK